MRDHFCGAIVLRAANPKANAMSSKPALTRDVARRLRRDQTDAERILWLRLRNSQLEGFKFRRQFAIGPFFADFCCQEAELVVELDGSQHADQSDTDERRTQFLRQAGYRVLRFWNHEVTSELDEVLQRIADALEGLKKAKTRRL